MQVENQLGNCTIEYAAWSNKNCFVESLLSPGALTVDRQSARIARWNAAGSLSAFSATTIIRRTDVQGSPCIAKLLLQLIHQVESHLARRFQPAPSAPETGRPESLAYLGSTGSALRRSHLTLFQEVGGSEGPLLSGR